jgi:hypothetical protein
MAITLWLRKRKRRVISEDDIVGALMVITSQHEFTLDEQVIGKVVAQAMLQSGHWYPKWTKGFTVRAPFFGARWHAFAMIVGSSIRVLYCQRLL